MNILFVSSEVAPFAKVGGLGDVGAALPKALAKVGHDIRVVMPCYRRVWEGGHDASRLIPAIEVQLGPRRVSFETWETTLPGSDVPVYLVHAPDLYDRPNVYTQDSDEHVRFALLNWAALRIAQQLGFSPDIVHANDWQTALLPLLINTVFAWDRLFAATRTVLTLHNIGHQGTFAAEVVPELGLSTVAEYLHQDQLGEGRVSLLLTGLLYADAITTVSPTYAREIQTPEHGVGLDAVLRERSNVVVGILNGIDGDVWSPGGDPHTPFPYSAAEPADKARNKDYLQGHVGLPQRSEVPVFGIISRLAWQKGFDLCFEALPALLAQSNAQLVVLGSGESRYESFFAELAHRLPERVAFKNGFSEPLAHLIEAGADMFIMPSRYEPCGLNQMYSCVYGTPPIVFKTGGLADTIEHWNPRSGRGNGFVFEHFDVQGLKWALGQALESFSDRTGWARLVNNCMQGQFAWSNRVPAYEKLYAALLP